MTKTRFDLALPAGPVSCLVWEPQGYRVGDVLLLHGGGLDSADLSWSEVGTALAAAGHRVYAPDHPGYGHSAPAPWPATQERLVEHVGDVVGALGLGDHVIVGLSLGGGMALGHVLNHPEGVRAAVLIGTYGVMDRQFTGPLAAPAHWLTWLALRTGLIGAMMRASVRSRRLMRASLGNALRNPAARTPELLDTLLAATPTSFAAFEQWQRDQYGPTRLRTDYSDRLHEIGVPVLFVHGDHDVGVPLSAVARAAAAAPDADLLVVADAAHWAQRDRPDVVVPALLEFLARHR